MFCTKCGKQLDEGVRFCTGCGAPVELAPVEQPAAKQAAVEQGLVEQAPAKQEVAEEAPAKRASAEQGATEEASATQATDETVVIPGAQHGADETFVLPESALEPKTDTPKFKTRRLEPVVEQPAYAGTGPAANSPHYPEKVGSTKRRRNRIIAISSAAAVVVVAAVGVLLVLGVFNPATPIDSSAFPNDIIRGAVQEQLDEDGDGKLSKEEASAVTALVYTNDGAQFIIGDSNIDAPAIRQQIKDKATSQKPAGSSGNANAPAGAPSSASSSASSASTSAEPSPSLHGLASFENLKTLIADNSDLNMVDLTELPNVEYVDLRGNSNIKELDLSANSNLSTLFCDPSVTLTGLDKAGLYFTDLISSVQISGASYDNGTKEIQYDSHGRPVSANGKTYAYDDAGRLISAKQDGEGGWYETYTYGDSGLLASSSSLVALDIDTRPESYLFGYDGDGRLTQLAKKGKDSKVANAGVFDYLDGKLVSYKSTEDTVKFDANEAGQIASAAKSDNGEQTNFEFAYDEAGALMNYSSKATSPSGSINSLSCATSYDGNGAPVKSAVSIPSDSVNFDVTYACNADGYVTDVKWGSNAGSRPLTGASAKINYIKRVGSLEDRASERYVPVFRLSLRSPIIYDLGWTLNEDWFASTGNEMPISFIEWGPQQASASQMGILPEAITNANELKLTAYDREHWTDGLTLSGEQTIGDTESQALLDQASKVSLPVSASEFLNDEVYGPVVKEYQRLMQETSSALRNNLNTAMERYPDIPLETGDLFTRDVINNLSNRTFVCSYVDLNGDGVNELAISTPSMMSGADQKGDTLIVYGNVDGKPKVISASAERSHDRISANSYVFTMASGGAMAAYFHATKWNGSEPIQAAGFEYSAQNPSSSNSVYSVTQWSENSEKSTGTMNVDELSGAVDAFTTAYPYATLSWTSIS